MPRKTKKRKKFSRKSMIRSVVAATVLLVSGYGMLALYYQDKFYPGTVINGQECGGKDVAYIKNIIKRNSETYSLTIKEKDNKTEIISGESIKLTYQDDKSLDEIKKKQNSWLWPIRIFSDKTYKVNMDSSYDAGLLTEAVNQLACLQDANMTPSVDAKIEDNGTSYVIVPEIAGTAMDKEKTASAIKAAVDERKTEISLEEADCYLKPAVLQTDEKLKKETEHLNAMTSLQIGVNFEGQRETITRDMLKSWIQRGEDGTYYFDEGIVKPVVIEWSNKYNTYGNARDFQTSGGYNVHLTGGDYGWRVWQDKTTESLMAALRSGQNGDIDATWLYKGQSRGGNDIDGTYVEISISEQRMWFYKDGSCLVDTPVVTGNPNQGNGTPAGGVWRLKNKQSPSVLVGRYPDGTIEYETPVTYWLPFNGGIGIHDLSNRSSYGGDIYLYNGSHGCVNTPFDAVSAIYENIEINTPIVVY